MEGKIYRAGKPNVPPSDVFRAPDSTLHSKFPTDKAMNRLHVHVHAIRLPANIRFYSQLFGAGPSVVKTALRQVDAR